MDDDAPEPWFSLIVASIGDGQGLGRLLKSLEEQTFRQFEVIVVDQNDDLRLDTVLTMFSDRMRIQHVRCEPGLSKARNIGIAHARASVIGFPDDDCWYPPQLLADLHSFFQTTTVEGVSGLCLDASGRVSAGSGRRRPCSITKRNVWGLAVSATIFLRRTLVLELGGFNESLGLGAKTIFQSGEETDLLLRALTRGRRLAYVPRLVVHHPAKDRHTAAFVEKAGQYGLGMGRVLRLHDHGPIQVSRHVLKPLIGALVALLLNRPVLARTRWTRMLGRVDGWRWRADDRRHAGSGRTPSLNDPDRPR